MTTDTSLQRIERWLLAIERTLLTVLIVTMMTVGVVQVLLRKTSLGGLTWADTFLRNLVLWVAFLGAGVAAAQDKHFGADLGERFFTGRRRRLAQLVAHIFTVIVCGFLTRASIQFIREEFGSAPARFHLGSVPIPGTLFEIILPLGFLLLLVHYALRAVADLVELRR